MCGDSGANGGGSRSGAEEAAFQSIDDLKRRVPALSKDELRMLAEVGRAESAARGNASTHALWEAERELRRRGIARNAGASESASPLAMMDGGRAGALRFLWNFVDHWAAPWAAARELEERGITPAWDCLIDPMACGTVADA